jgi:chromosome partitioning protein
MNAKGGVGKTVSTVNFAAILALIHNKRILVIDCDSQGNTTGTYYHGDDDIKTLSDIFENKDILASDVILKTEYKNIDLLPADLRLQKAEKDVLLDTSRPQQTRLRKALKSVEDKYDFCLIDCPPNVGMCAINAITASDDVLVPLKIDKYSMQGLNYITDAIENYKEFNNSLEFRGCFITQYSHNRLCREGKENLKRILKGKVFDTHIRQSIKVSESTFEEPMIISDPKNNATIDYIELVEEYLKKIKE